MTGQLFWDVDTQVDFMLPHGKLYVRGAEALAPNLALLTNHAHENGIRILASSDNHDQGDEEISENPDFKSTFPPHCLRGTEGQTRIAETTLRDPLVIEPDAVAPGVLAKLEHHHGDLLFHKRFFDVFTNPNLVPVLNALRVSRVVLYGVALDVCVRHAVEGLLRHFPDTPIAIVTDAVQALDEGARPRLLDDWQARGATLTLTREVLRRCSARTRRAGRGRRVPGSVPPPLPRS